MKGEGYMKETISISLPAKSEYVSIARLTASVLANKIGFDIEEIEDIKVAVGEACNNAVLHGIDSEIFTLNFHVKDKMLEIEVVDCGSGFELEQYIMPDLENPKENGLGLFIIKSLMDEVIVDTAKGCGTKIKMIKNI